MSHCGECKIYFCNTSALRVHVNRKHPGKLDQLAPKIRIPSGSGNHLCAECNKCFASLGNLRVHVKQKHSDKLNELAPIKKKNYPCDKCNRQFDVLKQLAKHKSSCHIIIKTKNCALCDYSASATDILVRHYEQEHNLNILNETLEFDSLDAFQVWKSKIEADTLTSFVQTNGAKKSSKHTKTSYFCHRSGNSRTRGNNIRKPKTCGSNKIGGYCPAKMIVFASNEKCIVQFCKSHVGHDQDMGHLFLTQCQRENIAAKIGAKIPFQVILDEVRDSMLNCSLQRIHLLTKKDLYNIENSFNLKGSAVRRTDAAVTVDGWVNELKSSDSVLFYKPQDSLCEAHPELKSEDFVLIIMTDYQKELLEKFGNDCICIDRTHGLDGYGFELHTILIIDDSREGYPCAFFVSNRCDVAVFKLFFTCVKKKIEREIRPHVFMSETAEAYYTAWTEVMLPAEFRLFCTWHVDNAWRENLDKIADKEKKVLIYQMLRTLLQETDVKSFQNLLEKFLLYCKESSDTTEFAIYFENNYVSTSEQWAYCYRLCTGLNTNVQIERMHHSLKHLYLHGKFVNRLDKALGAIMKFVRDRLFERLNMLHKGKVCTKISALRKRHKNSEDLDLDSVTQNDMAWLVLSASRNETYEVIEIKSDCSCMLVCDECKACIHRYSCTCIDSAIQWNMCKHIHLVCKFIKQHTGSKNEVNSVLSENNLVIDINHEHVEISGLVKNQSTIKAPSDVQQQIDERRKKLIQYVQDELHRVTSLEEIESAERILAPLQSTIAAVSDQSTNVGMPSVSTTPHNKKKKYNLKVVCSQLRNK